MAEQAPALQAGVGGGASVGGVSAGTGVGVGAGLSIGSTGIGVGTGVGAGGSVGGVGAGAGTGVGAGGGVAGTRPGSLGPGLVGPVSVRVSAEAAARPVSALASSWDSLNRVSVRVSVRKAR